MATESKLWQDVNALGGVPANEYERGGNDAIGQVLTIIEASGHAEMIEALREIETICTESASDCRKRMGTRVGNVLVTARAALAKAGE